MSGPTQPDSELVAVIGAGVVGLTTAVTLLERGVACVVFAEQHCTPDAPVGSLASSAAPAVFTPFAGSEPARLERWVRTAFDRYAALAREQPGAGVRMTEFREYLYRATRETPMAALLNERPITPGPPGTIASLATVRPHILTARFLPWLESRVHALGGRLVQRRVQRLEDLFAEGFRVVVNCAGVGARALAGDALVRPIAGQVVHVPNTIGLTYSLHDDAPPPTGKVAYIFTYDDRLVLGSTNLEGEWSARISADEELAIIDRCRNLLRLDGHPRWNDLARGPAASAIARYAGLRPARGAEGVSECPRVEAEPLAPGRTIVHHYGHGRSGVTLAWGTAAEAADLVVASLR
jgi:D-amino-acid oxidase